MDTNGHDKAQHLRQLNREYQPLLSVLAKNKNIVDDAMKLVQLEYHRKRQQILRSDEVSAHSQDGDD
jgi:hypothetical protein